MKSRLVHKSFASGRDRYTFFIVHSLCLCTYTCIFSSAADSCGCHGLPSRRKEARSVPQLVHRSGVSALDRDVFYCAWFIF